ncbi:MAG: ABC transporter permease [Gammaproteobacteria bacterium]|nr:ABC transporter permease [Gammaproteobacteria bacterium]
MNAYLKIALRNLYREKRYAIINIAGLALAIACCLVLGLYLRGELSYDRHNVDHEKIYRVVNEFNLGGSEDRFAVTSPVLGQMLTDAYPEVEDYTRFRPAAENRLLLHHEDQAYYWDSVYFADDNVFDVFTHDVIYGDPETALVDPASAAVSESFARRYWGDENPIGETIATDAGVPLTVRLVFADLPPNTHLKYDALLSINYFRIPDDTTQRRQQLFNVGLYTYLVMPQDYDVQDFAAISADFFDKNMAETANQLRATWRAWIQPLADIHLSSDVGYDEPTGNRYYLYGFAAVALFILVVACINYVNLATARATRRARSVGIRKILGSGRWPLMLQFLGEAVLFALIAAVVGVVIVEVVLAFSPVERLIGTELRLDLLGDPGLTAAIVGASILVGVLAGLYPAVYLSSWAPLTALVGEGKASRGSIRFRQGLVLAQFVISIAVIASTLLMAAQMRYVADRPLGFEKQNRVMITLRGVDLLEREDTVRNELSAVPGVLGMSTSASLLGRDMPVNVANVENDDGVVQPTTITHMGVGDDYLSVMGMRLVAGRDFSQRLLTDVGTTFIVNETFAENMGWSEPLGKRIQLGPNNGRVIGVVSDFNFQSLHTAVEPFAIYPLQTDFSNVSEVNRFFVTRWLVVNLAGDQMGSALRDIEEVFRELDPIHPFEFRFLDDSLNELYASEQTLTRLIGIFGAICVFIACLGLFGLAAFTTEQRTKEIGIRKVLGATAAQIIWLLSRNVLLLILAGAVLASVIAYLAVDEWLAGFAYRAPVNPLVFGVATLVAAAVAYVTIALQSYRTAHDDPVDALRYE